ncbi:hypothetical protein NCG89_13885 [Spongiibacter taiwanensis]|uniref:DUF7064 domain-containing protein n=1 Tax=Spongiibacter taiwanensis TaxID=1748242 RepID=UPI00203538CB|nr:hypothetical protein [Spongiibacter taiwanensis]USA42620.1 hypothetical protein NCG89_13885 [Spongiibacter taiwanensis]
MFKHITLARENLYIDPVHDNRHPLPDLDTARESIPYTFHIPALQIAGLTYTWVNSKNEAGAAMALSGPGIGDKPIEQLLPDRKLPDTMDYTNWQIDGFQMRQDLKFDTAAVRWESPDVLLEFDFEAIHPPYAYSSHAEGCPPYAAFDRIEQAGRCRGRIVMPGREEITFDTFAHRDHSWGTRDWRYFQHYNWFHGQSLDGNTAIHYWRCLALGREIIRGYLCKDGTMAEIVGVESDMRYDDTLYQQQLSSTITDELGRSVDISADFYTHYTLRPSPLWHLREGAATATIAGQAAMAWVECGWPPGYLENIEQAQA